MSINSTFSNFTFQGNKTNNTETTYLDDGWPLSKTGRIAIITSYSLIATVGIPGNLLIIIILSSKKYRRNSSDVFLMSLAIFDFLASICIPLVMIHDMIDMEWRYGFVGCKILPSMNNLTLFASAWNLVVISLDRFRVIMHPFHARLSKNKMTLIIIFIWITAIAVSYPYAHVNAIEDGMCWAHWDTAVDQFIYFLVLFILIYLIPIIIMIASYTKSIKRIMNTKLVLGQVQDEKRYKQNAKILKMFILIVAVFTFLTTPYFFNLILFVYTAAYEIEFFEKHFNLLNELNYGFFTMAAFNSGANWIIYAKMHPEVRRKICGTIGRTYASASRTTSAVSTNTKIINQTLM